MDGWGPGVGAPGGEYPGVNAASEQKDSIGCMEEMGAAGGHVEEGYWWTSVVMDRDPDISRSSEFSKGENSLLVVLIIVLIINCKLKEPLKRFVEPIGNCHVSRQSNCKVSDQE